MGDFIWMESAKDPAIVCFWMSEMLLNPLPIPKYGSNVKRYLDVFLKTCISVTIGFAIESNLLMVSAELARIVSLECFIKFDATESEGWFDSKLTSFFLWTESIEMTILLELL